MALREEMERQGGWLFRFRSYLPLAIIPILIVALRNSEYLDRVFGHLAENIWEIFSFCVSFVGLVIRFFSSGCAPRGTSGRNTKGQAADALNITGMYSVVRNPLYLGNFIIVFGMVLFIQVWWFSLIFIAGFWWYYERIIFTEEEFLRRKFGDAFLEWAKKTPIFIPRFKNWRKPVLSFSYRRAIRREFSTFFALVASFTFLDIAGDLLAEKKLEVEPFWVVFFFISVAIYIVLAIIKKKTKILDA